MYTFISSLVTAIGFGLCMFFYKRFKGETWSIKRTILTTIRFFILYYAASLLIEYMGILK
ncbi:hypothetical protein CER18_00990 [Bartonella tribocorum]|uniref:Uncharacterized protein n=1 Tax=Bartonella tribocorum TaxID=85701 RepID=A0A2M6UUS8_9HYPH|nr:hypothetical protein CER18_00990 [Bartonella tribocorum]